MKHVFMTTDVDVDAGYIAYRAVFDNSDPGWSEKARACFNRVQKSGLPLYRLSWYTTDDDGEDMELVGNAEDLY